MEAMQQGIKSSGFTGAKPSPFEERAIVNFHRVLSDYLGANGPQPITKRNADV